MTARDHDPAKAKFIAIQALRLSGVAILIYAILVIRGVAPWPGGVPIEAAYALALIGMADAFLVPLLLARMWSSDRT